MLKCLQRYGGGSSRLGFSCARLPGRLSPRDAVGLLECALDSGLTHFDTARMYGNGEADALLGLIAVRRRREMVIFAKAGITPAPFGARAFKRMAGRAAEPRFKQFSRAQVRASVETSLRNLRTDYLDALLLHDVCVEDASDDLREVLEELRRSGKILRWGVAASVNDCEELLAEHADLCGVVQAPAGWLNAPRRVPPQTLVIVHSVLDPALRRVEARLAAEPAVAAKLQAAGVDTTDDETISQALLQRALRLNAAGVTLFSTSRRERVISNAGLMDCVADAAQPALATAPA